jgi:hypothetical protein
LGPFSVNPLRVQGVVYTPGGIMYKTCSNCENWEKPEKNDSYDWFKESLKMVSPDCDKKRTAPCKPSASSNNLKGK